LVTEAISASEKGGAAIPAMMSWRAFAIQSRVLVMAVKTANSFSLFVPHINATMSQNIAIANSY
jgi:hypothetical protein